jgi:hypothetical protein
MAAFQAVCLTSVNIIPACIAIAWPVMLESPVQIISLRVLPAK